MKRSGGMRHAAPIRELMRRVEKPEQKAVAL
jgi:hypothetical protein